MFAYRGGAYDGDDRIRLLDLDTSLPARVVTGRFQYGHSSPAGRMMAAIANRDLVIWSLDPP